MKTSVPPIVVSALLLLAACSSTPAAPKPDRYCPGVTAALPGGAPATVMSATSQIDALTQAEPPGNDKPLDHLVLALDEAIVRVGKAQGILGGGASANQIAGFYSALGAVKAYCKARS
jgi:hypothetical protein